MGWAKDKIKSRRDQAAVLTPPGYKIDKCGLYWLILKIYDRAHAPEYDGFTIDDAWNLQTLLDEYNRLSRKEKRRK